MQGNRRDFIKGCCAAAVAAGLTPARAFFDPLAMGGSKGVSNQNVLVYVFLRGAIDGLHMLVPYSGPDRVSYVAKRGNLAIPTDRLRALNGVADWRLHPRAGGSESDSYGSSPKWLQKLYNDGRLGIVHSTGMPTPNRSHFEAQAMMELGTPGITGGSSGWLARYLAAATGLPEPAIAPAYGFGSNLQTSLIGLNEAISFNNAQQFRIDNYHWSWNNTNSSIEGHRGAHTQIYPLWNGNSSLERAGRDAADALEYMRTVDFANYVPGGGAEYQSNTFATQLRHLAQMLKDPDISRGLIAAAVDHGFWDTHESQGMPGSWDWFGNLTEELSRGLHAFYADLNAAGLMNKVTVIVHSEFGRRFLPNASAGTDHGYANIMMALGNRVNGGQLHGEFPGLDDLSLFQGQDVAMTTDFRQVISEALVDRMGLPANRLSQVFPGFSYNAGLRDVFQTG